jgi:hypothetical protein
LAQSGYDAQQTDEPLEPDRRDNLWEALAGDHGAHGTFEDRAITLSPQLWLTKNQQLAGISWRWTGGSRNRSPNPFTESKESAGGGEVNESR